MPCPACEAAAGAAAAVEGGAAASGAAAGAPAAVGCAVAVSGTPITAKAHIGHSWGQDGLGPNATAVAPTGEYWDWSIGADVTWRNLTFNASYVDTDISNREAAYLRPSFSKGQDGSGNIAGGTLVASLTAAF